MSKSKHKNLKARYIALFNKWVRLTEPVCFTCDNITVHASHFITSTHEATRFDERNVHGQCLECHRKHDLKLEDDLFYYNMIVKYGNEVIRELIQLSNQAIHRNPAWYEEQIKIVKEKIKELVNGF